MCEGCWSSVGNALPIQLHFDAAHAIGWAMAVDAYDGRMKDIIHALKYDRRRTISPRLGDLMRERGAALLHESDCVVPVPLHPRRAYTRGFNQAHDLAIHLGFFFNDTATTEIYTQSQIDLPREERHRNVRDLRTLFGDFERTVAVVVHICVRAGRYNFLQFRYVGVQLSVES